MSLLSQDPQEDSQQQGFWSSFERDLQTLNETSTDRLSRNTEEDGRVMWDFKRPRRRRRQIVLAGLAVAVVGGALLLMREDAPIIDSVAQATPIASPQKVERAVSEVPAAGVAAAAASATVETSVPATSATPAASELTERPTEAAEAPVLASTASASSGSSTTPVGTIGTPTYSVQVAAKPEGPELDDLRRQLAQNGYPVYVEPVTTGAQRLFRVRIGPLVSKSAAEAVSVRLQAEGHQAPWIAAGESLAVPVASAAR